MGAAGIMTATSLNAGSCDEIAELRRMRVATELFYAARDAANVQFLTVNLQDANAVFQDARGAK